MQIVSAEHEPGVLGAEKVRSREWNGQRRVEHGHGHEVETAALAGLASCECGNKCNSEHCSSLESRASGQLLAKLDPSGIESVSAPPSIPPQQ